MGIVSIYVRDPKLIRALDELVRRGVYSSRSRAIEAAIKLLIRKEALKEGIDF